MITYTEWKHDYEQHDAPDGGWRLCDYDEAERYDMYRDAMREEYPAYFAQYLLDDRTFDDCLSEIVSAFTNALVWAETAKLDDATYNKLLAGKAIVKELKNAQRKH